MDAKTTPELLPGTLFMMILRSLRKRPLHGYAIAQRIHEASENGLQVEAGSLYPALNRMLVKGWLKAEWGLSGNNRRARFYSLTRAGRRQLQAETKQFEKVIRAIQLVMRTV
jgi:PadR family transcriptional regulator, regulatory protein PadR